MNAKASCSGSGWSDGAAARSTFQFNASGIPGTIIDMIGMDSAIQAIVAKGAELAMEPMMTAVADAS